MRSRKKASAFTLVELLVVIGILSVLIALLFPALSKAKEHANRVRCASNLRSIGQAMVGYTTVSGYYPACFAGNFAVWPVRLRPFLNGNQGVFHCPSQDPRCEWRKGFVPAGAKLATESESGFGYEPGEPLLDLYKTPFSYGYNFHGTGDRHAPDRQLGLGDRATRKSTAPGYNPPPFEVRASRVKAPAEMIAIADGTADGSFDFGMTAFRKYDENGSGVLGRIHNGSANILFCDGHVAWRPRDEVTITYNANPMSEFPIKRLWNNDNQP